MAKVRKCGVGDAVRLNACTVMGSGEPGSADRHREDAYRIAFYRLEELRHRQPQTELDGKTMTDAAQKQDCLAAHADGRPSVPQWGDAQVVGHGGTRRTAAVAAMFAALLAGPAPGVPADTGKANANLVRVLVTVPRPQNIPSSLSGTGTIAAQIQSAISFQTAGRVTERLVEVGQHATADQLLARLDPTEQLADVASAEAALNSANAQLREAQITFRRNEYLLAHGYAPRAVFDQAKASLQSAEAQVTAAQALLKTAIEHLSYTELRARRDGIIVDRSVEVGQVVLPGQAVFTVAEDGPRDAVFEVPEIGRRISANRQDGQSVAASEAGDYGSRRGTRNLTDPQSDKRNGHREGWHCADPRGNDPGRGRGWSRPLGRAAGVRHSLERPVRRPRQARGLDPG